MASALDQYRLKARERFPRPFQASSSELVHTGGLQRRGPSRCAGAPRGHGAEGPRPGRAGGLASAHSRAYVSSFEPPPSASSLYRGGAADRVLPYRDHVLTSHDDQRHKAALGYAGAGAFRHTGSAWPAASLSMNPSPAGPLRPDTTPSLTPSDSSASHGGASAFSEGGGGAWAGGVLGPGASRPRTFLADDSSASLASLAGSAAHGRAGGAPGLASRGGSSVLAAAARWGAGETPRENGAGAHSTHAGGGGSSSSGWDGARGAAGLLPEVNIALLDDGPPRARGAGAGDGAGGAGHGVGHGVAAARGAGRESAARGGSESPVLGGADPPSPIVPMETPGGDSSGGFAGGGGFGGAGGRGRGLSSSQGEQGAPAWDDDAIATLSAVCAAPRAPRAPQEAGGLSAGGGGAGSRRFRASRRAAHRAGWGRSGPPRKGRPAPGRRRRRRRLRRRAGTRAASQ